jgi:hypothetical protein
MEMQNDFRCVCLSADLMEMKTVEMMEMLFENLVVMRLAH